MRRLAIAVFTLLTLGSSAALAAPTSGGDIAAYAGQFSALRDNKEKTGMFGVEYRVKDQFNGLRPTIGAFGNGNSAFYGYAGAYWDLPLNTGPFVISPGFAIGSYHRGDSKALGDGLEFRSVLETTYRFKDGQRVGAQISHLSNAGLGDENPGVETIQVVYSHPF